MTNRTAAARYARALLDVSAKEGADPDKVEQDLAGFIDLLKQHSALEQVLLSPAVPAARKLGAVVELTKRAGLSPLVAKLLTLLGGRDRLVLLPDLLAAYREQLLDRRQIVPAEVTTAAALPRDRAAAIEGRLSAVTGKRVSMVTRVDPQIIGGVVARVGSTVYDGSVATQLKKMKEKIVGL